MQRYNVYRYNQVRRAAPRAPARAAQALAELATCSCVLPPPLRTAHCALRCATRSAFGLSGSVSRSGPRSFEASSGRARDVRRDSRCDVGCSHELPGFACQNFVKQARQNLLENEQNFVKQATQNLNPESKLKMKQTQQSTLNFKQAICKASSTKFIRKRVIV